MAIVAGAAICHHAFCRLVTQFGDIRKSPAIALKLSWALVTTLQLPIESASPTCYNPMRFSHKSQ
uniref:hypothetical protein n=1 Tax=Pseudomonas syringae TaxID=317 RepID=UPI001E3EB4E4|nr:hypothetical protein [Pseudomonas syringae]